MRNRSSFIAGGGGGGGEGIGGMGESGGFSHVTIIFTSSLLQAL